MKGNGSNGNENGKPLESLDLRIVYLQRSTSQRFIAVVELWRINCSSQIHVLFNTEEKQFNKAKSIKYKIAFQPFSLLILLASLFALLTVQLPRVRGESNDGLFLVAAKGKSDATCNCANFNDVICRNCYNEVIKCNQVCGQECCQYSTFNVSGCNLSIFSKWLFCYVLPTTSITDQLLSHFLIDQPNGKKKKIADKKGEKKGGGKKKQDKKKPKKNEEKKPPRHKPNSLSYSASYRYRGHIKDVKKGKRGKRGSYRSYSMSHSLRYHGRLNGRNHHVSAFASDVDLDHQSPEYVHQVSPHTHLGGRRGRALGWSSDIPKRFRSLS